MVGVGHRNIPQQHSKLIAGQSRNTFTRWAEIIHSRGNENTIVVLTIAYTTATAMKHPNFALSLMSVPPMPWPSFPSRAVVVEFIGWRQVKARQRTGGAPMESRPALLGQLPFRLGLRQ